MPKPLRFFPKKGCTKVVHQNNGRSFQNTTSKQKHHSPSISLWMNIPKKKNRWVFHLGATQFVASKLSSKNGALQLPQKCYLPQRGFLWHLWEIPLPIFGETGVNNPQTNLERPGSPRYLTICKWLAFSIGWWTPNLHIGNGWKSPCPSIHLPTWIALRPTV